MYTTKNVYDLKEWRFWTIKYISESSFGITTTNITRYTYDHHYTLYIT